MKTRLYKGELIVSSDQAGTRLDCFVLNFPYAEFDPALSPSRSVLQRWIADGRVSVNGNPLADKSYSVKEGDTIAVEAEYPIEPPDLLAEPLDIRIVYQDEHLIVLDKPPGVVSHPAPNVHTGTVVNFLKYHNIPFPPSSHPLRPGIVHRLDKNTSGLMVVASTDQAYLALTAMIKRREVHREYLAIVYGKPPMSGTIDIGIKRDDADRRRMAASTDHDARQSRTHFKVVRQYPGFSLLRCTLDTGRTHQIRVHMSHLGYPVAGDAVYGGRRGMKWVENILKWMTKKDPNYQATELILRKVADVIASDDVHLLHATMLSFTHPITGEEMIFNAEPHEKFREVLRLLDSIPQK
jgi:23S rRNA pseudouridine1911/1915/1917 synthase